MVVIVIYVCLLNVVLFAVYYVLCIMCTPVRRTALLSTASLNNKSINQSIYTYIKQCYQGCTMGLQNGLYSKMADVAMAAAHWQLFLPFFWSSPS